MRMACGTNHVWSLENTKPSEPVKIALTISEVTLGRAVESMRCFPQHISRHHAFFKFCNGNWTVTDLKSGNGVFVNSRKISPSLPVPLDAGDLISLAAPNSNHVYKLCKVPTSKNEQQPVPSHSDQLSGIHESSNISHMKVENDSANPYCELEKRIGNIKIENSSESRSPLSDSNLSPVSKADQNNVSIKTERSSLLPANTELAGKFSSFSNTDRKSRKLSLASEVAVSTTCDRRTKTRSIKTEFFPTEPKISLSNSVSNPSNDINTKSPLQHVAAGQSVSIKPEKNPPLPAETKILNTELEQTLQRPNNHGSVSGENSVNDDIIILSSDSESEGRFECAKNNECLSNHLYCDESAINQNLPVNVKYESSKECSRAPAHSKYVNDNIFSANVNSNHKTTKLSESKPNILSNSPVTRALGAHENARFATLLNLHRDYKSTPLKRKLELDSSESIPPQKRKCKDETAVSDRLDCRKKCDGHVERIGDSVKLEKSAVSNNNEQNVLKKDESGKKSKRKNSDNNVSLEAHEVGLSSNASGGAIETCVSDGACLLTNEDSDLPLDDIIGKEVTGQLSKAKLCTPVGHIDNAKVSESCKSSLPSSSKCSEHADKVVSNISSNDQEEISGERVDENDFFPVLSQAFYEDDSSYSVSGSISDFPSNMDKKSVSKIKTEACVSPTIIPSKLLPGSKMTRLINPLPMRIPSGKRHNESALKPGDATILSPPPNPVVDSKKLKDNKKPKKGSSIRDKIKAKLNHRIPIAGGGSDVRKRAEVCDTIRIVAQKPKIANTSNSKVVRDPKPSVQTSKIPKKTASSTTLKRLPETSTSRSKFLTEEIDTKPKKKGKHVTFMDWKPSNCGTSSHSSKNMDVENCESGLKPDHPVSGKSKTPPRLKNEFGIYQDEFSDPVLNTLNNWSVDNLAWKILSIKEERLFDENGDFFNDGTVIKPTKLWYESIDAYISTFLPLLAIEAVCDVSQTWRTKQSQKYAVAITKIASSEHSETLHCQSIVLEGNFITGYSNNVFLIRLSVPAAGPEKGEPTKYHNLLGILKQVSTVPFSPEILQDAHPLLQGQTLLRDANYTFVNLEIACKLGKLNIDQLQFAKFEIIDSIRSHLKLFSVLLQLPSSPIVHDILSPRTVTYDIKNSGSLLQNDLNASQRDAVGKCNFALQHPHTVPKIVLIQGPPGTGKSHTIIRLIEQILYGAQDNRSSRHILLAAHSNGAVDELIRKLAIVKKRYKLENSTRRLKFVRIGQESQMTEDAREFSLEKLTNDNIAQQKKKAKAEFYSKNNSKYAQFTWNEEKERESMRQQIILFADIIITTLNSCKIPVLDAMMKTERSGASFFSALIVDEACQCTELDLFYPLRYRMSKIILVGDPFQLPATVISREAAEHKYGRSYFERVCDYFNELRGKVPINLLTTQYRMHPQICSFPASQFYRKMLTTHNSVLENIKNRRLKPYIVLNVLSSEVKHHRGIRNASEAKVVVNVCSQVVEMCVPCTSVAIITPYRQQKLEIIELLKKRKMTSIEVNTVDGFQGREMDVVILSCVRANKGQGNIGFLSDYRRLNVAITRAKECLILCGNLISLEVDSCWKALIDDALSRNVKITTDDNVKREFFLQKSV